MSNMIPRGRRKEGLGEWSLCRSGVSRSGFSVEECETGAADALTGAISALVFALIRPLVPATSGPPSSRRSVRAVRAARGWSTGAVPFALRFEGCTEPATGVRSAVAGRLVIPAIRAVPPG